jgi:hypothetical protein
LLGRCGDAVIVSSATSLPERAMFAKEILQSQQTLALCRAGMVILRLKAQNQKS